MLLKSLLILLSRPDIMPVKLAYFLKVLRPWIAVNPEVDLALTKTGSLVGPKSKLF